ncbi:hypothetical protein CAEBREN_29403 [Caenorhabditis brenneri]|uniref:Uncharacterized protein n=1 Tax=Caenorhabditis brenneri TaxID=135651 RepID=G0PBF2_CAEBE|nr:hypothetical protein CAEBREN_29403 [Caenorhabditis brenneri]
MSTADQQSSVEDQTL